jgi:hypothetical protein
MNSVPRKLTLGLILAVGAAACGDDVTVTETTPVTPTPSVRSVVVSPPTATIAPGGTFTFGAAVDADAPLARTVTWSSSNASITVTSAGVASAPASLTAGGVSSICAVATANADVKGCAQLTVTPGAPAATVNIDAITVGCSPLNAALPGGAAGCGLQVPVQVNNVGAQIDVSALVRGASSTNVVFQVLDAAGTVVLKSYTQTLTAQTLSSDEELTLQQQSDNRVVQSINTAEYDLLGTGGSSRVFFLNGEHKIRVCLSSVPDSCTGAGQTAVALRTVTFRNANGFHMSITTVLTSGTLNANGLNIRQTNAASGLTYVGGTSLALQAVPVSYTGQVVAAVPGTTVNFGSGCDPNLGARAIAAAVSANGVMTGTLTYTAGAAAAAGTVNNYQITPAGACGALGEVPFAAALDNTGNAFINFGLAGNFAGNTLNNILNPVVPTLSSVQNIRLDNGGPSAVVPGTNMNGRNFGWFNGAVQLNVRTAAATPDGAVTAGGGVDAGVGGTVTLQARGGVCTSVATCAALPIRVRVTDAPALAETLTGFADQYIVQAVDLFGNFTNSGTQTFGVDVTLPIASVTGGPATNTIQGNLAVPLAIAGGLQAATVVNIYAADDFTGTVGANPSGIVGPGNVFVNLTRRDASSSQFWCPANGQYQPAAGACVNTLVLPLNNGWQTIGGVATTFQQAAGGIGVDPATNNLDAYYGIVVSALDNAGNLSTTNGVRSYIHDQTAGTSAPAATGPSFLPSVIPAAATITFTGAMVENLDGARSVFGVNYPLITGGSTFIRFPWAVTGAVGAALPGGPTPTGFNLAGPSQITPAFTSTQTVPRSIEQTTAGNGIAAVVLNTAAAVNGFQYMTWDVARNFSTVVAPAIGFGATGLVGGAAPAGSAAWSTAFTGGGAFATMTWQVCGTVAVAGCATVGAGNIDVSGNAGAGNVNSRVVDAVVFSGTNPFQPPFLGGVKFYVVDAFQTSIGAPAGTALVEVCSVLSASNDQATNTWKYSCTYNPSTLRSTHDLFGFNETTGLTAAFAAASSFNIIAVGYNTTGAGLATQPIGFLHQQ